MDDQDRLRKLNGWNLFRLRNVHNDEETEHAQKLQDYQDTLDTLDTLDANEVERFLTELGAKDAKEAQIEVDFEDGLEAQKARETKPVTCYLERRVLKSCPDPALNGRGETNAHGFWFKTPPLTESDISQLTSIQLITHSKSEKLGTDAAGSGSWFQLAIRGKDDDHTGKLSNGQTLAWLSHSNWFGSQNFEWCRGRMFTRDDEIFKHLKPGDIISVWISAGPKHANHADLGCLVFGFGSGSESYETPKLPPGKVGEEPPLISVHAQKRQECFMTPADDFSGDMKANIVDGGVDLMYQLLEPQGGDWTVERHPIGLAVQAEEGSPNFDSLMELDKPKDGSSPRIAKQFAIERPTNNNSADSSLQDSQPDIIVWDDSGVKKGDGGIAIQDPSAEVLIYQMHAPLWSGTLWNKFLATVDQKIIADKLNGLEGAEQLFAGGRETLEARLKHDGLKEDEKKILLEVEQHILAEAKKQALEELERKALEEAERRIRKEAEKQGREDLKQRALEEAKKQVCGDLKRRAFEESELEDLAKAKLDYVTTAKLKALTGVAKKHLSAIVVVDVDDLRADGIRISRGISWEKTMEDFKARIDRIHDKITEKIVDKNEKARVLAIMRRGVHLLVRCGYEGVLHLRPGPGSERPPFVFHMVPNKAEGDLLRPYNGQLSGIHLAFVTGLAAYFARQPRPRLQRMGRTQIGEAIKLAIVWSHRFASVGLSKVGNVFNYPEAKSINNYQPFRTKVIYGDERMIRPDGDWSLFNLICGAQEAFAAEVVKLGSSRLEASVPTARFGLVQTADRTEIEGYRSTAAVIHEYLRGKVEKPLSIAVFGQPGAGKSFGVKQVIKAVLQDCGKKSEPIEANLSQFLQYSDLVRVFDKVRDTALTGETPVVLFDEFDSAFGENALGWLKYFLAPMQDGQFLDSGFVRPLPRAIFIFIGGTSSTFREFKYGRAVMAAEKSARDKVAAEKKAAEKTATLEAREAAKTATDARIAAEKHIRDLAARIPTDHDKKAKKPDFVSRLSAHIDVKGPNESDGDDVMFVMRRAMLLQGQLRKHFKVDPKDIHVDETVLNALLKHKHFPNGTRSIELILQTSRLSGRRRFESSDLASNEQLNMHVGNVAAFHELIDKPIEVAPIRPVDAELFNKWVWAKIEPKDSDL